MNGGQDMYLVRKLSYLVCFTSPLVGAQGTLITQSLLAASP